MGVYDLGLPPDEVFKLSYRQFFALQERKIEEKYFWSHHFYSVYSCIINMTPRKKGAKVYKAEDFIGTLEKRIKPKEEKKQQTPDEMFRRLMWLMPPAPEDLKVFEEKPKAKRKPRKKKGD